MDPKEKEIKNMVKKELSDLKFSDFIGAGHVYDHKKSHNSLKPPSVVNPYFSSVGIVLAFNKSSCCH